MSGGEPVVEGPIVVDDDDMAPADEMSVDESLMVERWLS